ncbi:MAG: glycosyltransferase family 4 protein [Armatimonadota bacterium]|nr:glycosyltransferase family 4 protein [Armatimonadota bacterium]MDR7435753.1 glycosyltransferase family 4 protein [Armatimonadota bacterium]
MHVAVLAPIAWRVPPRHYGGWEIAVRSLVEGLTRRGVEVTLFATADSSTSARLISVCPKPLAEDPSLAPLGKAYEFLHAAACFERAEEFDVIHNHAGSYWVCFSRLVKTPVITTLHGSAAEPWSRLIYSYYREGPYISVTDAERLLAPELTYIATIHHGVEVEEFPFGERPGEYLLFVGRIARVKGIHLAIEVAKRTGMPLILAGIVPPEEEEYFHTQVSPHIDGEQIRFIGPAEHPLRNQLYAGAYAFLHLIQYHEAFGLTMIEAMACGTPVIAIGMGSVPEIVAHGRTGFIVHGVEEAVEAVERIPRISREACRTWVAQRFHAQRMVDQHIEVYERVRLRKRDLQAQGKWSEEVMHHVPTGGGVHQERSQ